MNTALAFHKESIQRSSNASESLNQAREAQGQGRAGEPWFPTLTTITVTQL